MKASPSLLIEFQMEAIRRFPEEACGFVVKKGRKQVFMPCKNSAPQPLDHFRISDDEYARCADAGEILAVWHSHPNKTNQPSESDKVGCEDLEVPWFINGITKDDEGEFHMTETFLLEPTGYQLEYLGRPYHYGLIDCYSLLVDWYKREKGVQLDKLRWTRNTRFWELDDPVMESVFESIGFEKIHNAEPEIGDVFLMQCGGVVANHVAIYIGDDMILHHCEGRLSSRSIYGGYWHKHTVAHLRHETHVNEGDS